MCRAGGEFSLHHIINAKIIDIKFGREQKRRNITDFLFCIFILVQLQLDSFSARIFTNPAFIARIL